ncbi:ABC transporter permease [Aureimonas altamirensis]|uniref:ABC transporter permease n=1 Tax=Aureimonas altamirensis TaxID=370622 RepID=UPI0020367505|nr:ABC transporter permease [Aureimonas altamirensis]MCM2505796.1 ABC transporter permease [Aureimonas altamirensis]
MSQSALSRVLTYALVGLVLAFLILPIAIIVPMSFSDARFLSFPPRAYSLRWYEAFFTNPAWMGAARTSLSVALLATIVATPIGIAAAYAITYSSLRIMRVLRILLMLPLMVPIIIVAIGVFLVYAQIGLLSSVTGLVFANTMLGIPFVVLAVTAGLQSFDHTQEMVARSLGMNRFRAFMTVTLPQIRPSVISGAIFVFISSLDETVVALFISGGEVQTLTRRMFTALRDEIDPTIAAISTLLTVTSFALIMVIAAFQKKDR